MQLIEEVEKTRRGLYGGVLGYLDFAGNADFAIAIRTALMRDGTAYVQAGGGVVADSNGPYEYDEAANKARGGAQRDRRRRNADGAMTRVAQLLLVLAALALWVGSRMPWVDVTSFDGLGQPKTTTLTGAAWSTALVPLALVALAAAVAALAVRGWLLRLARRAGRPLPRVGMGYLGIGLWVIRDVAVRAADLAQVPVTALIGTQRHYWGAVLTLVAAGVRAGGRGAAGAGGGEGGSAGAKTLGKYLAPAAKREAARQERRARTECPNG